MRQLIAISLFLSSCFISKAQNNAILESKKGFKDFVIGTSPTKFNGQLSFIDIVKGENHFVYTGNCCQTMLDYEVQKVDLYYKDYKLVTVKITLPPVGKDHAKADAILDKFSTYFGKPDNYKVGTDGNTIYDAMWVAKSVHMLLNVSYNDSNIGFEPEIFIFDRSKPSAIDF